MLDYSNAKRWEIERKLKAITGGSDDISLLASLSEERQAEVAQLKQLLASPEMAEQPTFADVTKKQKERQKDSGYYTKQDAYNDLRTERVQPEKKAEQLPLFEHTKQEAEQSPQATEELYTGLVDYDPKRYPNGKISLPVGQPEVDDGAEIMKRGEAREIAENQWKKNHGYVEAERDENAKEILYMKNGEVKIGISGEGFRVANERVSVEDAVDLAREKGVKTLRVHLADPQMRQYAMVKMINNGINLERKQRTGEMAEEWIEARRMARAEQKVAQETQETPKKPDTDDHQQVQKKTLEFYDEHQNRDGTITTPENKRLVERLGEDYETMQLPDKSKANQQSGDDEILKRCNSRYEIEIEPEEQQQERKPKPHMQGL